MTRLCPPGWLRPFEPGCAERMDDRSEVGELGARVAGMCQLGLPVPNGFALTEGLFRQIRTSGRLPGSFRLIAEAALGAGDGAAGRLSDPRRPLLLTVTAEVRRDKTISIAGVGLNDASIDGLIRRTGNPRYAWETYRRLVAALGTSLFGIDPEVFENIVKQQRREDGMPDSTELGADALRQVVRRSLRSYEMWTGQPFPTDPMDQLEQFVLALSQADGSGIAVRSPSHSPPAVILIQSMVFGNTGARSGSGVAYTRDPVTGDNAVVVDFLFNGAIDELSYGNRAPEIGGHAPVDLPYVQHVLGLVQTHIESRFGDMQEVQFVVEDGALYAMRSRPGRRSPAAALRMAVDLVKEGQISPRRALELLSGLTLEQLRCGRIAQENAPEPLSVYKTTSSGVATGLVTLSSRRALEFHRDGQRVIQAYDELNSEDVRGMAVATGVLTVGGGLSSRIASMARQMGLPCLVTRADLSIDHAAASIRIGSRTLREGDSVTIDGNSGRVYPGELPIEQGELPDRIETVRRWLQEEGLESHPLE